SPDEPFQSGPWIFRPQLQGSISYATGLLARSNDVESTSIAQVSPGVIVDYLPHWEFSDTPTLVYYSNKQFHNQFDNTFTVNGATEYEDWIFGFFQSFIETSQPNPQTGAQTQEQEFLTRWSASYAYNSVVDFDMLVSEDVNIPDQYDSSRETVWLGYLNYKMSDKTTVGIGGGPGYVSVELGPDQIYEQLLGRIGWHPAQKLFFTANGGFQERETIDGGVGPTFNPVFSATLLYNMTKTTTLSAFASEEIIPSYFAGMDEDVTSLGASLSQRLFKKFFFSVSGSYNHTKFVETVSTGGAFRTDDYYILGASLGHGFGKRGQISLNYQYSDQKSTVPGYSYKGSQIGLQLSYSY
ncbi:MAG TPA: outer membrane beta-barrel protein, partial [Verrucomicrobiae bacterium]|nr:outer membrane beta-barrel protein [Verrucomicrobiae bacterium]